MRRVSHLAMAALMVGSTLSGAFAATPPPPPPPMEGEGAAAQEAPPPPPPPADQAAAPAEGAGPEAPPPPPPAATAPAAAPAGGIVYYEPPPGVVNPNTPVEQAIQEEQATRAIPDRDAWRNAQHLSWHMDWHLGNKPERYHHLNFPGFDRHHSFGHCRKYDSQAAYDEARRLSEAEIAAENSGGKTHFVEDHCCPKARCWRVHRGVHTHLRGKDSCCHQHRCGEVWANEWERSHPRYFWKIKSDINNVGVAAVPQGEDHTVPLPRPVRWNESRLTCPLPYSTWFAPPADHTIVVPFPLPREGDWRAHISPGMNKIVDQTDWLRAVTQYSTKGEDLGPSAANCGPCKVWKRRCHRRKVVSHPQGD